MPSRADTRPRHRLAVISLFSGALGLDLGLEQSGLELRVAVESDRWAAETIRANRPDLPVIDRKIEDVPTAEILDAAGLKPGEAFLVSGGPSCEAFSTAGRRRSLDDPRGTLFREFLRVIRESRPRFFVMENVRGVLSAAIRHRPLAERGPGFPALAADEQHGAAFRLIVEELAATEYFSVFDLINTADFGVPQVRQRVVFVGSRDGEPVYPPRQTHSRNGGGGLPRWRTLEEAVGHLDEPDPVALPLQPHYRDLATQVPPGGNWRDLPADRQQTALGRAFDSWGGRNGFLRRLAWDQPAPALTTRPNSRATMLLHPNENRPLSVAEYAAIQGFPPDWSFGGLPGPQYRQIGNAVPIRVGKAIGDVLVSLASQPARRRLKRRSIVACASADLLRRYEARPRTILNPPRMRSQDSVAEQARAAREWTKLHGSARRDPLPVKVLDELEAA